MVIKCHKNEKGFTLVEIIAVLVILGILAALAIPKYLDMTKDARSKSAQAAIGEVKGRLSSVQVRYLMNNHGIAPTSSQLYNYAIGPDGYNDAAVLANVGMDFNIIVTTGTPILISVIAVGGVGVSPSIDDTFTAVGDH